MMKRDVEEHFQVKSGHIGRSKSLKAFIEHYKPPKAYKISQAPYQNHGVIQELPLYAIESLKKNSSL